ncbi:MAG: heme-binding protein [Pseudomonadota bacterium]
MEAVARSLAAVVALAAAFFVIAEPAMATEEPKYELLEASPDGAIEVRRYAPTLRAEVTVDGDRDQAASAGFRILAAFIFGDNETQDDIAMTAPVTQTPADAKTSEKIAMTAPVTQTPVGERQWTIGFVMPSKYTVETLPKPTDPRISIVETPGYDAAAVRFSGRYTASNFEKHQGELDTFMADRGLLAAGSPTYLFYNGPFTPFFMRRNEIMVRIERVPAEAAG